MVKTIASSHRTGAMRAAMLVATRPPPTQSKLSESESPARNSRAFISSHSLFADGLLLPKGNSKRERLPTVAHRLTIFRSD